jgi:hypothetical protein
MPIILAVWEAEIETIEVQDQPGKIDPISKITRAKGAGGVVQVVERLFANVKP